MMAKRKPDYEVSRGNVFADLGLPNSEEALAKTELAQKIFPNHNLRVPASFPWCWERAGLPPAFTLDHFGFRLSLYRLYLTLYTFLSFPFRHSPKNSSVRSGPAPPSNLLS